MARKGRRRDEEGDSSLRSNPGAREKGLGVILQIRTQNQHRCPWVSSPRRVGVIQAREFGKLAPYPW